LQLVLHQANKYHQIVRIPTDKAEINDHKLN